MVAMFRYTLARFRGQIIGWGGAIALLGLLFIPFYDTIQEQSGQFEELLKNYPPELMAMFGVDVNNIESFTTPSGYLSTEYFVLMPVILGIFAVLAGSGLLASDEENGTLDLIAAHPLSRSALFAGRVLAMVAATALILTVAWLGLVVGAILFDFPATAVELALPFMGLLGVLLLFGALALALSMVLPSRRLAAMVAGLLLVVSFFLSSLARAVDNLDQIARLSPLQYYQSGDAMNGLNVGWVIGLLAVAALFAALAWWRFERRDLRVAGEGGLSLPMRLRRAKHTS